MQLSIYLCSDMFWAYSTASSATRHQHTHSSGPTPNYTKDTICCICKEIVTSVAPEDGRISPKHVRTQINTQLHQVGKLFHISNQNAR